MSTNCKGCGTIVPGDGPGPDGCGSCPPRLCASCGQMDSMASPCSCWVSIEGMALADVKALFARDADGSDGPTLGI